MASPDLQARNRRIEARQKQTACSIRSRQKQFKEYSGLEGSETTEFTHSMPFSSGFPASGNTALAWSTLFINIFSSWDPYFSETPSSDKNLPAVPRPTPELRFFKYVSASSVPPEVPGKEKAPSCH